MKGTSSFAAIARPTRVFPDPLPPITFTRRTSRDDIDPFAAMAQRRSWNSDRIRPADAAIGPLRPPRVTVWAGLRHGWIGSGWATEDVAVEAVVGQGLGIPEPHAVLGAHRLGRRGEVGDRTRHQVLEGRGAGADLDRVLPAEGVTCPDLARERAPQRRLAEPLAVVVKDQVFAAHRARVGDELRFEIRTPALDDVLDAEAPRDGGCVSEVGRVVADGDGDGETKAVPSRKRGDDARVETARQEDRLTASPRDRGIEERGESMGRGNERHQPTISSNGPVKLHEYQAKQLLARAGIPIPDGRLATTADEAERAARAIGASVAVKA